MKIVTIALICLYVAFNLVTTKLMTTSDMKKHFITGQCIVGIIAANIFYAPAWMLKGIKIAVNFLVR